MDERTQPHRIWSQLGSDASGCIGHLQIEGDEVETVDALPVIEAGVNHIGVTVEGCGEQTLLFGRTVSVLLEEFVFVHNTDFF